MDSGRGLAIMDTRRGKLDPGTAGNEDMDMTTPPQPCVDCSRIFLEQSRRIEEEDPVEDRLWASKSRVLDNTVHVKHIVDELATFCKDTRNVHLKVKNWAIELQEVMDALRENTIELAHGVEDNYNEAKKMRRVLVGHADANCPDLLLGMYNRALSTSTFPATWKVARVVFLHKGRGKPVSEPSSYRPLCILDTAGKLLERLILARLAVHVEDTGGLSPRQFGFRQGSSTMDAIRAVVAEADAAACGPVQDRHLCVMITLDVRNTFNSAPWKLIDAALGRRSTPST